MAKSKATADVVTEESMSAVAIDQSKPELTSEDFKGWSSRDMSSPVEVVPSAPEPIEPPIVK